MWRESARRVHRRWSDGKEGEATGREAIRQADEVGVQRHRAGAGQGRLVQGNRPLPRPGPVHGRQRGGAPQDRDVAQVDEGPAGAGGPGRVVPEADVVTPLLQRVQEEKGVRLQPQVFLSSNR